MNKVSAGTITRTIVLALALVNQILTARGHSVINISDEEIDILVSTGITVIAAVIAWWKNNSFSKEAVAGDNLMNKLKKLKKQRNKQGGNKQ